MAREALRHELSGAVHRAVQLEADVHDRADSAAHGGRLPAAAAGGAPAANRSRGAGRPAAGVVRGAAHSAPGAHRQDRPADPDPTRDAADRALDQELQDTSIRLQTTVEEMETTVEELKSTNEELQSANEELQSTNEEAMTNKEEMQSLNEELMTLNMQYLTKTEELSAGGQRYEEPARCH